MQRKSAPPEQGGSRISTAYTELPNGTGAMYYEASSQEEGIEEKTLYILSIPSIITRCTSLSKLLRTTHTVELREIYPLILQHIFGWDTSPGWRLRTLKRELAALEIEEIMKLLRPEGPLIELTYRLMGDPNLQYEFPSYALPVGLQNKLSSADVPAYIGSRLSDGIYTGSSASYSLLLNPFELFFFHYAHAEIRQNLESPAQTLGMGALGANIADSIYSDLLHEYLNYFVPASDEVKVPPPLPNSVVYRSSSKPNFMLTPSKQSNNMATDDGDFDPPTIFKASVFQNDAVYHDSPQFSPHKNPSMDPEFWRTEAVLNILISMWLSVDEDDAGYKFGTVLPTVELVKSVRMIVRHWHLFSNVINRSVHHPMEELRRNIFPLYQKKLYQFLRYIFPRWPLDASFRIVYETWLSYIQPWRYTQSGSARGAETDASTHPWNLDATQCNFVLENLPFYTCLFQHVLTRLTRADFTALRNAHMLYRITKIYCGIENLRSVLYEMEKRILTDSSLDGSGSYFKWNFGDESSNSLLDSGSFFASFDSSFSSPGFNSSNSFSSLPFVPTGVKLATVKQVMAELESQVQDSTYVPLFSKHNRDKVAELVEAICHIIKMCEVQPSPTEPELEQNSVWDKIKRWFMSDSNSTKEPDYNSTAEVQKRVQLLILSRNNLMKLFNLPSPISTECPVHGNAGGRGSNEIGNVSMNSTNSYGHEENEVYVSSGVCFVPKGTIPGGYLDLRNGNPDTAPAQSYESRLAVECAKVLSKYLNRWVTPSIQTAYFLDTWKGRLCRAILARPEYYYELKKFQPGKSVREKKYLPPRLNFRVFASMNTPYVLIAYALLCWFFGIGGWNVVHVPCFLVFVYILMRALLEPKHFLPRVRYEFAQYAQASETSNNTGGLKQD